MKWEIPARRCVWIAAATVLLVPGVTPVWAGNHTVQVPRPNGLDDTAVLQSALDRCVAHGPACTVQLAAGRYLTKQLVAYNFRGTLRGRGKDKTIIEALPKLRVDCWIEETDTYWPPDTTEHPWSSLIIFVDGDIRVSDLGIQITAVPATEPYFLAPGWQLAALIDAIRFMGQRPTNATVERIAIEGREDPSDMGFLGFNLGNGVTYVGELPKGSGTSFDYYQISGKLTVSASSFKSSLTGVYPGIVKDGRVTIGGSPAAGNVFENVAVGMDLESLESSVVEVSHNRVMGARWAGAWAILWCCGFLPTKPSLFLIHDNTFTSTGQFADGIVLVDDPANPWIRALVTNNTIEAQDIGYGGISAYNTKGTTIWNNRISGRGADGIGVWNGTRASLLANDVEDFVADSAQIVLDGTTSHSIAVCRTPSDTVLDQGQDNRLIGCQQVDKP